MSTNFPCPTCQLTTNREFLKASHPTDSEWGGIWKCHGCGDQFYWIIPKPKILGVGPDAPTITNEKGAKQSASLYRVDLLPPLALLDVAAVLKHGADKYGVDNWRGIPAEDHVNHALVHIFAWLSGDTQDNHLGHASCRMLMAQEQAIKLNQTEH